MSGAKALAILGLLGIAAAAAGCDYAPTVAGRPVYSATMVPPDIERYPERRYASGYAYLVGHEWYFHDPHYGWVLFQDEPGELRAYRTRQATSDPGQEPR